jgi:POT family proton-dependent oligopeptide transporter
MLLTVDFVENYIQNSRDDLLHPGALGLGQSTATSFSYLFTFLVYTVPLFAAPMIDCYLGRYRGLVCFTW